ncbi:MAG: hypothetical protein ACLPX9_10735 [Rhodomicrobium sp.]
MENLLQPFPSEASPEETEVDRILGEVARRHRIIVSPGDPMVVVLTMFELVLGRYLQQADAILQGQRVAMTGTLERATLTAKTLAESLVTGAADYHVKTTRAAAESAAADIRRASEEALAQIGMAARNARWLLWLSWLSIAALVAVAIGVWIGIWISPEVRQPASRCAVTAGLSTPPPSSGPGAFRARGIPPEQFERVGVNL